ncbi:MAG: DUF2303 family protein [Proteobacteria bacterium]|uniref:DUF2303 family protein n=1 Tax=Acinetobacter venetianus (strain ATCC 31012 / DSM 23050 / BCRC 14357 / CCUG 45561 / CIP 110063 / KCTC 2702 / LMG 19082 / RAG-1) TaxID=1191460 RepID=N8YLD2_ACIVR|nr:DUF2303 family protein [Acinetobacter venetianus]ENV37491.1 hypothetical protein F959_01614 [Acinetobacter venetianus RAG-1 = CIP 110063]MDA0695967.1 DUF2303 family protein [Pseudomonadota bacterium]MDA1254776.1 DUF2303 family protein [Pseudomonadota bacterium]
MSLEKSEVAAVVEHCSPVMDLDRGGLQAVHENFKIHNLEIHQNGRNRIRGIFATPIFADFAKYIADAPTIGPVPVFVSRDDVKAVAVLNYSEKGFDQGHCDHTATLQLDPTVVWKKLNQLKDTKLDQKRFATFLEDWATVLTALDADDKEINIKEAIVAVRNMKVDINTSSDAEVENTREVRTAQADIAAKAKKGQLPAKFKILDTAYVGLEAKTIELRLIVNGSSGEPVFALQIVKEEILSNDIIQEFKVLVTNLLPDHQVLIGTFQA